MVTTNDFSNQSSSTKRVGQAAGPVVRFTSESWLRKTVCHGVQRQIIWITRLHEVEKLLKCLGLHLLKTCWAPDASVYKNSKEGAKIQGRRQGHIYPFVFQKKVVLSWRALLISKLITNWQLICYHTTTKMEKQV